MTQSQSEPAAYRITLAVPCGKRVGFCLPERPGTGYIWDIQTPTDRLPEFSITDEWFMEMAPPAALGAGGVHWWLVTVPSVPGAYQRRIPCWRPWNRDVLAWAEVTIHATEGSARHVTIESAITPLDTPSIPN